MRKTTGATKEDSDWSGAYKPKWSAEDKALFYLGLFRVKQDPRIMVEYILRSISKHHTGGNSQRENKGTSPDRNGFSPVSPSPSSFNLFVCRAAAHFWSTVVCLCQMPKRLLNEERHLKRGRVTVNVVCNRTHKTHAQTVTTGSCRESLPMNPLYHLCRSKCRKPVRFKGHLFRNTGSGRWRIVNGCGDMNEFTGNFTKLRKS